MTPKQAAGDLLAKLDRLKRPGMTAPMSRAKVRMLADYVLRVERAADRVRATRRLTPHGPALASDYDPLLEVLNIKC